MNTSPSITELALVMQGSEAMGLPTSVSFCTIVLLDKTIEGILVFKCKSFAI
jgi:hypothetical protein